MLGDLAEQMVKISEDAADLSHYYNSCHSRPADMEFVGRYIFRFGVGCFRASHLGHLLDLGMLLKVLQKHMPAKNIVYFVPDWISINLLLFLSTHSWGNFIRWSVQG